MALQLRMAAILLAFTASCGGKPGPQKIDRPKLETISATPKGGQNSLGKDAPKGFLRPCQTMIAGSGLVELRCDDYQLVEFRKPKSGGSGDADLDALMEVLGARFGELDETRRDAAIDSLAIRVSDFSGATGKAPQGMAASVSNSAGQYWAFACYKKSGDISKSFCGDAISTAARAGGLAYVDAKPLNEFGDGTIKVPPSCESMPGSKIVCPKGQLSWSPEGASDAKTLRADTLSRLMAMAGKEGVAAEQKQLDCQLLGKPASCVYVQLTNKKKKEALHFLLVTGGGQDRLVVCSYPEASKGSLPIPCDQAIELKAAR